MLDPPRIFLLVKKYTPLGRRACDMNHVLVLRSKTAILRSRRIAARLIDLLCCGLPYSLHKPLDFGGEGEE